MNEDISKVFSSSIIRTRNRSLNDYNDLLNIEHATPIKDIPVNIQNFDYTPRSDKFYIPKRRAGIKVLTVRDIREEFEKDVYDYLPFELEKNQNYLLRKIRQGCSKHSKTIEFARKILKCESPLSRSSWRMLMNINPEDNKFSSQFVLWNGKCIQINGSRGGKCKFICKYDISNKRNTQKALTTHKTSSITRKSLKRSLLQDSLNIKFKPGPLSKKRKLDSSYQKYNYDHMDVVKLPKPGLEVQPAYGKPITSTITSFLYHSIGEESDNTMSEKWADFATSTLGTNVNGRPVQTKNNYNVTFHLDYRGFQNKLLMRRDSDILIRENSFDLVNLADEHNEELESVITSEVKNVINELLGAVELSLRQDFIYSEDEPRDVVTQENISANVQPKDKIKKRYCELDRLDVTVIRITDNDSDKTSSCLNSFCNLGCICDSLSCTYNLKGHCGRVECMFQCTCDFSLYNVSDYLRNDCNGFLPEIINSDKKSYLKLAKEEQKFHQTVIVTNDKSILLKSRKRNWKTSKKYAEFYSQMNLKNESTLKNELSIVAIKLDCENIEPWCLVHNLYRCFCKGRFTSTAMNCPDDTKNKENLTTPSSNTIFSTNNSVLSPLHNETNDHSKKTDRIKSLRIKSRMQRKQQQLIETSISITTKIPQHSSMQEIDDSSCCARACAYEGRKYSDGYYKDTNEKIKQMEENDKMLHRKISKIVNKSDTKVQSSPYNVNPSLKEILAGIIEDPPQMSPVIADDPLYNSSLLYDRRLPNRSKLVSWLESSYKQYKTSTENITSKSCLGPPQPGKVALYPWDFILSRYVENKNYFLVSRTKPIRMFMAVNFKDPFFNGCINIRNIPQSDVDKCPVTVKNLITNAKDLQDVFCILYGLQQCWELIGSVTKMKERISSSNIEGTSLVENLDISNEILDVENVPKDNFHSKWLSLRTIQDNNRKETLNDLNNDNSDEDPPSDSSESSLDTSKWFVMTIEDDFVEIIFHKKGFFVKYDSVMKAIKVARVSGKTVRLSSKTCNNYLIDPQFGIYAIPMETESIVFIGPYENDEPLGIETVNTVIQKHPKNSTRGVWITTNARDNVKVIENPLFFIPLVKSNSHKLMYLNSQLDTCNIKNNQAPISPNSKNKNAVIKTVKPIKICKSNGFYQLAPNGILQQIPQTNLDKNKTSPSKVTVINTNLKPQEGGSALVDLAVNKSSSYVTYTNKGTSKKPVAEIAPQIKIYSEEQSRRKVEGGMLILKPEEINKRSLEGNINIDPSFTDTLSANISKDELDQDIEKFLLTSVVKTAPKHKIYIISDDDDDNDKYKPSSSLNSELKNVYIICKNVDNLGWIKGKQNSSNFLSFEFPGFKETDFYSEQEAFEKINQVFSRKVYIPKYIKLQWYATDDSSKIAGKERLTEDDTNVDYIMTKKGLRHKSEIMNFIMLKEDSPRDSEVLASTSKADFMDKKNNIIKELENTSAALEEECDALWEETMSKRRKLEESLIESDTGSQDLKNILNSINDSD